MKIIQPAVESTQHLSKRGESLDFQDADVLSVGLSRLMPLAFLILCVFAPAVSKFVNLAFEESGKEGFIASNTLVCGILGLALAIKSARNVVLHRTWVGLLLLCIFSLGSVLTQLLHLELSHYLSIVAIVASACLALGGTKILNIFCPFLMFMAFWNRPIQQEISTHFASPLQLVSTQLTVKMAGLWIPITGHGHVLEVKGFRFDIEPGCAGLTMLNSLIFAVFLWGMFQRFSVKRYTVLLALTVPLAIVLNSMRLTVMAWVAFATTQVQALQIHTNIEAIFLVLGLVGLWRVGGRLDESVPSSSL